MSNRDKLLFFVKTGVITLILYIIAVGVYFLWFYKPFEPHDIASVNQIYKEMHYDGIKLFLFVSLIGCTLVSLIIVSVYEEVLMYGKPVIEVYAKCMLKEVVSNLSVSSKGGSNVIYSYKLTFQLENGVEMTFPVSTKHYMTILEGNKGIVKYKKGRANRYVGFELKEVE